MAAQTLRGSEGPGIGDVPVGLVVELEAPAPVPGLQDTRSGGNRVLYESSVASRLTIVVTNPPFSLFREYIAQLMEHDKKFVVIGNQNAVTYKEVFPLIKENRIWLGCYSGNMEFRVPGDYEAHSENDK